ncbi:galactokinase [Chryseobacterium sp. SORGH_AS 447]|uniref:galactokinase n=1 Tax=Chryseobacterium sp. SORGH_AS_0447 TaxID=3041769 RepID=UPI0027840E55|nr:galactokinase [Chryseobacterium sp. SORGH_AS_0447]MDQ1162484.1 galactokinase [Chryseobacterium sp. SORGH_AS_0447]
MQEQLINDTSEAFRSVFQSEPERIFLAPGRINIIGEHVDYSDGFVLPAAIDKHICFAVKKTDDSETCTFFAKDFNESFSFNVNEKQSPVSQTWVNYLLGVFNAIQESGKEIGGLQIAFSSTIPMGSGLSSSAALECGFAYILNELFNLHLTKKDLALIGQKSEHTFVGVKCGIMDQFSSVFGKEHQVIMLDCNSLEHQYFEANLDGYSLVLFDSCVKHTHLTSGYNDRRKDVEHGKNILWKKFPEVQKFRDFTLEMLDEVKAEMGETSYKRCKYLLKEIKRVEEAAKALSAGNAEYLGKLLVETHAGLSTEFEVSCEELDFMVEETLKQNGVLGARMMGGGFGGCSINLIRNENVAEVIENITAEYKAAFGIEMKVYRVKISDGINEYKRNEFVI